MTFRRRAAAGVVGLWPLAVGLTLLLSRAGQAETAAPAVPQPQIFYSRIQPLTDTVLRAQGDPRPATADGALQLADWLVYSSLATGGAYDNNVNATPTNPIAAYGPRFQPTVIAERNTGIQQTFLYGTGDIRYYPIVNRTEFMDTTAGGVHVWEIQRDFIFQNSGAGDTRRECDRPDGHRQRTDRDQPGPVDAPVRIDVARKGVRLLLYRDRRECDARNLR